jgi:hypothetical protein
MKTNSISVSEVLLGLLFIGCFVGLYFSDTFLAKFQEQNEVITKSQEEFQKLASLATSIDTITLDTSVLKSNFLQKLTPLPDFPLDTSSPLMFGKLNPFSGGFTLVATSSTSTLSGVRTSNQNFLGSTTIITVPQR